MRISGISRVLFISRTHPPANDASHASFALREVVKNTKGFNEIYWYHFDFPNPEKQVWKNKKRGHLLDSEQLADAILQIYQNRYGS